jgi:hypothetical protein
MLTKLATQLATKFATMIARGVRKVRYLSDGMKGIQ